MTEWMNRLKDYGVDIDDAMKRLMDDEELYETCICSFVEDSNFAFLGEAIGEQDYERAFNCVHTLKGVAANLSLTPLLGAICVLVDALRIRNYTDLEGQYAEVCAQRDAICALF